MEARSLCLKSVFVCDFRGFSHPESLLSQNGSLVAIILNQKCEFVAGQMI